MLSLDPADFETLLTAPLFAGIPRERLLRLVEGASLLTLPEGGLLFSQGDAADRFFLVLAGRADLFALTEKGDQTIIEVFEAGLTFAEAAMFSSGRFPLNAEAAPGSRLMQIPAGPFLRQLAAEPDLGLKMLAALSRWQRRLVAEIATLKNKSPGQRLAQFLLHLAGPAADAVQVRLPLTKTVLASRLGITPESLSRAMGRLRALGVETRGRDVLIADVGVLRKFCDGA